MSKTQIQTQVYCSLSVEGMHNWDSCHIEEVSYLKYRHRHKFNIKAYVEVGHDDRDVEFIVLQHRIREYLSTKYVKVFQGPHEFGSQSCEMIARELIMEFKLSKCEVNEDGENGAVLTVT